MQVVHLDFIGPYGEDRHGHRYILAAIDYLTGWAEAYPTRSQSASDIIDAIALGYYPQHDPPEVFVSDNGQGFGSAEWTRFCEQSGVECRHSTPGHPQGNAKVERFNKTIKGIMVRTMGNDPSKWSVALPGALRAYRKAISDSTGFSPHFLLYGRPPKPFLERPPGNAYTFGNRLDGLREAWRVAQSNIERSRGYNRERLALKANVEASLAIGDTVCVRAEERITGTGYWDPGFVVTRVQGTTHWVRNIATGKSKKLHREKLRLTLLDGGLDAIPDRPRRQFRARKAKVGMNYQE